jgi:hypothetical protein
VSSTPHISSESSKYIIGVDTSTSFYKVEILAPIHSKLLRNVGTRQFLSYYLKFLLLEEHIFPFCCRLRDRKWILLQTFIKLKLSEGYDSEVFSRWSNASGQPRGWADLNIIGGHCMKHVIAALHIARYPNDSDRYVLN